MDDAEKPAPVDVVLLHGPTDDGGGIRVLRVKADGTAGGTGTLQQGEVRPLRDGQPFGAGEVVSLRPREKTPLVCDVEVAKNVLEKGAKKEAPSPARPGPAQVASDAYRASWERIFSRHRGELPS